MFFGIAIWFSRIWKHGCFIDCRKKCISLTYIVNSWFSFEQLVIEICFKGCRSMDFAFQILKFRVKLFLNISQLSLLHWYLFVSGLLTVWLFKCSRIPWIMLKRNGSWCDCIVIRLPKCLIVTMTLLKCINTYFSHTVIDQRGQISNFWFVVWIILSDHLNVLFSLRMNLRYDINTRQIYEFVVWVDH